MNPVLKLAHEKFTCQKYYPFNASNLTDESLADLTE
jgi:hypothetical protein